MKRVFTSIAGACVFVLFAGEVFGAPSISQVEGTMMKMQLVSVTGSGFGVKSPAQPYLWAPFEEGSIQPSTFGIIKNWDGIENMSYNQSEGNLGSGCAKSVGSSGSWTLQVNSSGFAWSDYSKKMYIYRKIKRNFSVSFNWKIWRMWSDNFSYPNIYIQGQNHTAPVEGGVSYSFIWGDLLGPVNVFNTEEIIFRSNSSSALSDGYLQFHMNGQNSGTVPDKADLSHYYIKPKSDSRGMVMNFPVHGVVANATMNTGDSYWADDVYVDTTWARIIIGNASTLDGSSHKEVQIPQSWSSTQIQFLVNRGSFTPGSAAYLFVVDADGNASSGKQIVFANSGGLSSPKNLRTVP